MALKREFTFLSGDGATQIHGIEWKPESGKICGILQIFHGMVEYIERYEDFAEFLTEKGFLVGPRQTCTGCIGRLRKSIRACPIIFWDTAWDLFYCVNTCSATARSWTELSSWEREPSRKEC